MTSPKDALEHFEQRAGRSQDVNRQAALEKRHGKGYRSARENLQSLCDPDSFMEYGQMAVAAQRLRRDYDDLQSATPADGVITGVATVNAELYGRDKAQAAIIVNDYSVLAGTQGYFHHKKIDRIIEIAHKQKLPVIMMAEGGGGRPGDTDVMTQIAGLQLTSFSSWAALSGRVPTIAIANGYCFAGNAALFGCADIKIATQSSWIGMAGPAMIEGGGLGSFKPTDIGPVEVQSQNGVIDLVVEDEAEACELARKILSYSQGDLHNWNCSDQNTLINALPDDRRYAYKIRELINTLADHDSVIELKPKYGGAIITGLMRIEGKAFAIMANDCRVLGGAIDAQAAAKAGDFLRLCDRTWRYPRLYGRTRQRSSGQRKALLRLFYCRRTVASAFGYHIFTQRLRARRHGYGRWQFLQASLLRILAHGGVRRYGVRRRGAIRLQKRTRRKNQPRRTQGAVR